MNCFNRVIAAMGLDATQQNENGWLHGLLAYAAGDVEGADTFANPAKEVIFRLETRGVGKPTLDRVRQLLHTLENGFESGSIS